jgi:folate-binding protein YgfZ
MTEGYKALTRAAGVIDLSSRTRIRATGEDRARLLHALTTNHIQQLLPGHGCYAFFLNANGRVIADANMLASTGYILIDAEPEVRESLWAHLDHYIIADDVTLHDDTDATFCLGVEGPAAEERLCALGAPAPGNDFAHEAWNDLTVARLSFTGEPGFRVFGPAERKNAVLDLFYLTPVSLEDADVVRIEYGRPRYGVDITGAQIAAETGQTQAMHFSKGCYLGQEIVERVKSRGHVNKRLVTMEFDTYAVPAPHAKVVAGEKEIGEITSAAVSPALGKVVALGYVRVPHEQAGALVEVGGAAGHVR